VVALSQLTGISRAERRPAAPGPDQIADLISTELAQVESLFRLNLAAPVRIVDEIGGYVAEGGGKRVRPTLHLLAARLCGYVGPHSVLLATVLEFIHSATLIHDDIIDDATTRRGRPSVNFRWGNNITVLFGDYLFAKAMEMALAAGSLQVMDRLAEASLRMTEGEMLQTRYVGRIDLTEQEYLGLIERKTAALFACCCELAGLLAKVSEKRQLALRRYGLNLGMAFQLVDDLLDFTGDAKKLGKPAASDLREGKATLAVIDLIARGGPDARSLVRRVMSGSGAGSSETAALARMLRDAGSIERAQLHARRYAAGAVEQLYHFHDGDARQALLALPDLLLSRDR
jgi:octaprenyl-diphosphate synthase